MEGLGIDWRLFTLQILNFGVIFVLLVALLRKPFSKVLKDRADTIEASLKDAKLLKEQLAALDEKRDQELSKVAKQSEDILAKSQKIATDIEKKAQQEASKRAEEIVVKAKAQMEAQKQELTAELKEELSQLISTSIKQSFKEFSESEQQKLADSAISQLEKMKS